MSTTEVILAVLGVPVVFFVLLPTTAFMVVKMAVLGYHQAELSWQEEIQRRLLKMKKEQNRAKEESRGPDGAEKWWTATGLGKPPPA